MSEEQFSGSMTTTDGRRVQLSAEEAKALWDACIEAQKERADRQPDTAACLAAMSSAETRLKELGWRSGVYCPRDGSAFAVCEVGSTGMWAGHWTENRTDTRGFIIAADCVHRPDEVYFKPIGQLTEAETALIKKCDADVAQQIERMGRAFESMQLGEVE